MSIKRLVGFFPVFLILSFWVLNSKMVNAAGTEINKPEASILRVNTGAITPTAAMAPEQKKIHGVPAKYRYLFAGSSVKESIPKIHIAEAKVLYESGKALFIDARGANEYNQSHIAGSESIPAGETAAKIPLLKDKLQDKVLVTYCHGAGCHLSDKTANALFDAGYRKIIIFFGGWPEWTQANMPVEKYEPPAEYKYMFEDAPSAGEVKKITLAEAKYLYDNGAVNFIDVDSEENFSKIRIDRAFSIPINKMDIMLQSYSGVLSQKPNVIYDHGFFNEKSSKASETIYKAGYKKILILNNALTQWEKAGYPLYKLPK